MNLRKIVVAVNDTPAAVHGLREAAVIADAAGAELLAVMVVENRTPEGHASRDLKQIVQGAIGPGRAQLAIQFGLPSVELARRAEIENADLLVLGREPNGDLARRSAGRTVAGTLARARMACLIVPFGQRTWRRVLAALGTGPAATTVDEAATAFAALWGAVPDRIHAVQTSVAVPASSAHDHAAMAVGSRPYGDPVGEVLTAAHDHLTDVMVIGVHRGETLAEAGRVAPHLIARAPCAVLTVPV